MNSLEIDRRTAIFGLVTVTTGTVSAGCLSGVTEPESDVTIEIEAEDEAGTIAVDGLTFGSDDASCGIVFVPQINTDRASWTTQAETLTGDERFGLAIDPDESRSRAIRGAVEYVRATVGVERVVLVGASVGGEAAVGAPPRPTTKSTA